MNCHCFAAPSSLKKTPLSPVVKERLSRFFCVSDRSRANLLSPQNLMASGITPLSDILARARAAALQGGLRQTQASVSDHPPAPSETAGDRLETRSRKRRHLIRVDDDPTEEEREEPAQPAHQPIPVRKASANPGKRAKTAGTGQPDLRSSLGDDATTLAFISGACQKMAAKYSGMVDLVKSPGYLQACIEAQIEVHSLAVYFPQKFLPTFY